MTTTRYPIILSPAANLNASWRNVRLLTKQVLTEKLSVSRSKFNSGSNIISDLRGDSLDFVEIAITLEKITGIRINERVSFNFVLEIIDYLHFIRVRKNESDKRE